MRILLSISQTSRFKHDHLLACVLECYVMHPWYISFFFDRIWHGTHVSICTDWQKCKRNIKQHDRQNSHTHNCEKWPKLIKRWRDRGDQGRKTEKEREGTGESEKKANENDEQRENSLDLLLGAFFGAVLILMLSLTCCVYGLI